MKFCPVQALAADEVVTLRPDTYQKLLQPRDDTVPVPRVELVHELFGFRDLSLIDQSCNQLAIQARYASSLFHFAETANFDMSLHYEQHRMKHFTRDGRHRALVTAISRQHVAHSVENETGLSRPQPQIVVFQTVI